ncbi:MAG TPA: hypothetical protein VKW06_19510 [Candidatus Angelobacter sp.]|nr:hypothetical protein [Candidatus Angelobacter sp.]
MNRPPSIFRIRAHNTAAESENKIHDDRVAAAYGFRGGLVPGVTVYGYMVPAVIDRFGRAWMERGGISVRFQSPCYESETVVSRCVDSEVTAEREDGSIYASGTVTENSDCAPASYAAHTLPAPDQRPVASAETITPGRALGNICENIDVEVEVAIPERLLRMANEILVRNFRMSPWIHTASDVNHHCLPELGQQITVTGAIEECFERKGRKFAVAGLAMSAGGKPVASVRHTFIYQL